MTTKQEVINDESKFQRVCAAFVRRNVIQCVSSLISDIGKNAESACEMFDLDYEEVIGWFQQYDYEDAVSDFIRDDADLDQLEWIADNCGYWGDVLKDVGYEDYCEVQKELDEDPDDFEDWVKNQDDACKESLREAVLALVSTLDEYREVAQEFDIDPYVLEVFEHWIVDRYFGSQLEAAGEIVFEFANMTIWGRCTTGQSISIDSTIRGIVKNLDENHWVWGRHEVHHPRV